MRFWAGWGNFDDGTSGRAVAGNGVVLSLLSSLLLLGGACGGKVVVDGVGAAGGAPPSCADACNAQQGAGCFDGEPGNTVDVCVFRCTYGRSNAAGCVGAYDAFVACVSDLFQHAEDCASQGACSPQLDAYDACILHGSCEQASCPPTGCTATCGGVTYQSECAFTPEKTCSCLVNGTVLGSCQPPHEDGSTYLDEDLTVGCCAPFFQASQ